MNTKVCPHCNQEKARDDYHRGLKYTRKKTGEVIRYASRWCKQCTSDVEKEKRAAQPKRKRYRRPILRHLFDLIVVRDREKAAKPDRVCRDCGNPVGVRKLVCSDCARENRLATYRASNARKYHEGREHRPLWDRAGSLTAGQWSQAVTHFSGCAYCGAGGELHREHFAPVARGGNYTRHNIVPACPECNQSKGDTLPIDWLVGREHGLVQFADITGWLSSR